jgi:dTDP-4-amino-4,6-dideoxygalactose transaminase
LGSFGDGGMVTTNSEELYDQLKVLRVHGSEPKYYHKVIGGNFRLDALQAGVVSAKLNFLEGWTEKRRGNAETYNQLFKDSAMTPFVQLPPEVTFITNMSSVQEIAGMNLEFFSTKTKLGAKFIIPFRYIFKNVSSP